VVIRQIKYSQPTKPISIFAQFLKGEMKSILILCFTDLKRDARVMRQVNILRKQYQVTVVALNGNSSPDYELITLPPAPLTLFRKGITAILLSLRSFTSAHRYLYPYESFLRQRLGDRHFDLMIANDIEPLPFAFELQKPGTKVIFDAHEYYPLQFEEKLWWNMFFRKFNHWLCKTFIPKVDGMMTVSNALAEAYEQNYGRKPVVVTNSPFYQEMAPRQSHEPVIRLVHHGIVNRSRKIELLIDMMDHLPSHFTLDLVMVVSSFNVAQTKQYLEELKARAARNGRVHFVEPVAMDKVVNMLHEYDMGVVLMPPVNFNQINSLPNKLFDFIQARIGVLTGPSKEIARVVKDYQLGVVGADFTPQGMVRDLARMTRQDIENFKQQAALAAKELNAEKNEIIVNDLVAAEEESKCIAECSVVEEGC
jgi:hypothetical protein